MMPDLCLQRFPSSSVLTGLVAAACLMIVSCSSPKITLVERPDREVSAENAGPAINSPHDDFAPAVSGDGASLMFTSNRPLAKEDDAVESVYRSDVQDAAWGPAHRVDVSGDPAIKAGSIAFDDAHSAVVFVQCYRDDGVGDCDLYAATTGPAGWSGMHNAGRNINSPEWDCHPTLTRDGSTLYFASERIGGVGGSDIYASTRRGDGTWSTPVNLGPPVNTTGDEKAPHISADGRVLYFSSNGHPGYGAFDVFESVRTGATWSAPRNCGRPINSSDDDLFYVPSLTADTAYLASNRGGGQGGYDIYQIIIRKKAAEPPPAPKRLTVRFIVRNAFTLEPLPASIQIAAPTETPIKLTADEEGGAEHILQPAVSYAVVTTHDGFNSSNIECSWPAGSSGMKEKEILLTPIGEKESIIYSFVVEFDFNLSNIREREKKNLDSVATLLTRYPDCSVLVSGHTDSVGTDEYNMRLGEDRAREVGGYVERYLRDKGVTLRNELEIRSFGESRPVASNSTDEGRQRNRRVVIDIKRLQ